MTRVLPDNIDWTIRNTLYTFDKSMFIITILIKIKTVYDRYLFFNKWRLWFVTLWVKIIFPNESCIIIIYFIYL